MANTNRFSLTDPSWSLTAQEINGATKTISYSPPVFRESYTTLQDEITNASTGTLNLTDRGFAPTVNEVSEAEDRIHTAIMNYSGGPLTIIGGTFFGGVSLGWGLADSNGIRSADLAGNINNDVANYFDFDGVAKLHDEEADDIPFMCTYPPTLESQKYAPATFNSGSWISVKSNGEENNNNVVHLYVPDWELVTNQTMTDAYDGTHESGPWQSGSGTEEDPIVNYTAYVLGMTINDPAMQTQFAEAVAGGIDDLTIMVLAGPNVVTYHEVLSYNSGTHRLDFATTDTGPYYPNYLSVAFTGNPDWITQEGHFCMTRSDKHVHYKPLPGSSGDSAILGMLPVMFPNRYGGTDTMHLIGS